MKKARLMLMTTVLLGIVGGALAFKASTKFGPPNLLCYTTTLNSLPTTTCQKKLVTTAYSGISTTAGILMSTLTTTLNNCPFTTTVAGFPTTYYCTIPLYTNPCIYGGGEQ